MKKAILALAVAAFAQVASASIAGGSHDLTAAANVTKYGSLAAGYTGLTACNFCHAVHKANTAFVVPLWNRNAFTPASPWVMYAGALTGGAPTNPPGDASLACLSCHEGSATIGSLFSTGGTSVLTGGTRTTMDPIASRALVTGNDLRDDHPVSFTYVGGGGFTVVTDTLSATANVNGLPLYGNTDRMECGSCHDPHTSAGRFLRVAGAALCTTCHADK